MQNNLGDILKANIERNNGMITREAHNVQLRRTFEEQKKTMALHYLFDLWKLTIIHKIELEEAIVLDSRKINSLIGGYICHIHETAEIFGSAAGVEFKNWLKNNGLKMEMSEDHDGCGRESWISFSFSPI